MEKLLMSEPTTLLGKAAYISLIVLLTFFFFGLVSLVAQGIPAAGKYLQYELGIIGTGYLFMGTALFLGPATLVYILFRK